MDTHSRGERAYPRSGLRVTIDRVGLIKDLHGQDSITRDAACVAMGYTTGRSGAAQGALSSAMHYGLLETRGTGHVGVSGTGMVVLVGEGDERRAAMEAAAYSPPLHQRIRDHFSGDATPPREAIARFLELEVGLMSKSAAEAAKRFLDAIQLVGPMVSAKTVSDSPVSAVDEPLNLGGQSAGGTTMPNGLQTRLSGPLPDGDEFFLSTRKPITSAGLDVITAFIQAARGSLTEAPRALLPAPDDDAS